MKHRAARRRVLALAALIVAGAAGGHAQDLTAVLCERDEWRTGYEPLEFVLSRHLEEGEQVTLIVGTSDVSDLSVLRGNTLRYVPAALPLPRGAVGVSVYVVTSAGEWSQVGGSTINVLTAAGLERSIVTPTVTLSYNGQLAEDHFPESNGPARSRFHELNGQLGVSSELERGGVRAGLSASVVGVSFRPEALRFSEKGADAPKVDLAGYVVETQVGRTSVAAGHVTHGRSRHLLSGFSSRGVSITTAIGAFADLSGTVMNGTSIVGWDNPLGLANSDHRIYSGTLGLEVLPESPGTIRIEGSYVHGSQLPLTGYNQSQINDAEESSGGSVRLICADPGRSVVLDAGLTVARFVNPNDPLMSQGIEVVPVEPTTRQARYADIAWDVVRDGKVMESLPARVSIAFRHERVDPLFRAVGANVRSDFLSNMIELRGGIGPLQLGLSHQRAEDNLADVASVLKSKTRQTGINAALAPGASAEILPSWLPAMSYVLGRTHQFGVSVPTNSEFTPDLVPDQVTTSHAAGLDWQGGVVRWGYRGTYTIQDNRQPGREQADAVNRTNGVTVTVVPVQELSASVEGSLESNENLESGAVIRNRRFGTNVSVSPWRGTAASVAASISTSEPDDGSSTQRQALLLVEASHEFDLSAYVVFNWRGRVFARYSWSEFKLRDNVFDLSSCTRAWTVQAGLSLNLF